MKLKGTIRRRDLEGGIVQLSSDDGRTFTLLLRPGDPPPDGARVEVEGEQDEGFGFAMAGPQLRVARLRRL